MKNKLTPDARMKAQAKAAKFLASYSNRLPPAKEIKFNTGKRYSPKPR